MCVCCNRTKIISLCEHEIETFLDDFSLLFLLLKQIATSYSSQYLVILLPHTHHKISFSFPTILSIMLEDLTCVCVLG